MSADEYPSIFSRQMEAIVYKTQFRIPVRTGASCVKPSKVRLMRGRNASTRALQGSYGSWNVLEFYYAIF